MLNSNTGEMMPNGNDDEPLRQRLLEVARRYPQAEIARRTGEKPYNVSRYLRRGNRIPAGFLARVATELGVNATWLLQGQGTPWLADIRGDHAGIGGNLLELVSSMAGISRLRLGALAGKEDASALRELNDALAGFERVRLKLADASRPAFRKVLDDWTHALSNRDLDRSRHFAAAAQQAERLCPDPELELLHLRLRAWHENELGRHENSLQLRQRIFLRLLAAGGAMDERAYMAAYGVVAALVNLSRIDEGIRYARAADTLAPQADTYKDHASCQALYGWALVQTGDIAQGLPLLLRVLPRLRLQQVQDNGRMAVAYAQYLSGAINLDDAAVMARGAPVVLDRLLFLSPWSTDADEVQRLLKVINRKAIADRGDEHQTIAQAHLAALRGDHAAAMQTWRKAEADEQARSRDAAGLDFALLAMRTQLLRLAGKHAQAHDALNKAEGARQQAPENVTLDLNWRRIHWRNALLLATGKSASDRALADGARQFAQWAAPRGIQAHAHETGRPQP